MTDTLLNANLDRWLTNPEENFLSEDKEDEDSFRVMLRISKEFHEYLEAVATSEYSTFESAAYVSETVRSGFDCFFDLHPYTRILEPLPNRDINIFGLQDFAEFKIRYQTKFRQLQQPYTSMFDAFSILMDLWRMHFIFLGLIL
jgi:hypothetical protein